MNIHIINFEYCANILRSISLSRIYNKSQKK